MREVLGRDALARVGDGELPGPAGDRDRPAGRRVPQCVDEEVVERLAQPARVRDDAAPGRDVAHEPHAACLGDRPCGIERLLDELGQVHAHGLDAELAGVTEGEVVQVVDEAPQVERLLVEVREQALVGARPSCAGSIQLCMLASGLRSSCETSPTIWRRAVSSCCRRSAMRLKACASRPTSSTPGSATRASRSPSATRSAAAVSWRSGRTT